MPPDRGRQDANDPRALHKITVGRRPAMAAPDHRGIRRQPASNVSHEEPKTIAFAPVYRLVPRGRAGLACDTDGVTLGQVPLVDAADINGRRGARTTRWRRRSASPTASPPRRSIAAAAVLPKWRSSLTAGEIAQAGIRAVLLALPEISRAGMARLANAADLQKYNPHWADEARAPAGTPEGGQWTADGEPDRPPEDAYIQPAAAQTSDVQAKKERFVDAHLDAAEKVLPSSASRSRTFSGCRRSKSGWGASPFAANGNNYFGIHWPAPRAAGYMFSRQGTKVATFANYAESLKSFIAVSGSLIRGKNDPEVFATALQNSGKFGIYRNGAKVPTYVDDVAEPFAGFARSWPGGKYEGGCPNRLSRPRA